MNSGGDARVLARQAVAAAAAIGDARLESVARNTLGTTLVIAGDEDEGLAELARAGQLIGADRPLRDKQPDGAEFRARVRYHLNYSDALHSTGHYEDALRQALTGVEAARAVGIERDFGSFAAGNAAESMLALGQLDAAAALIEQVMRLDPPTMSLTHLNILTTWLELWRGNLAAAERSVVPLRSLIVDVQPMPQSVVGAIRVDAELAMFSQQPERAWSHLQCFLDHANLYDPGAECSGARGRGRRRHRPGSAEWRARHG